MVVSQTEVFDQCHEHIRTIEQRRDVVVGLLFAVILSFLGFEGSSRDPRLAIAVTLVAIGVLVLLGVFRRWKLVHLHAASVFMLLPGDGLPTQQEARRLWATIAEEHRDRLRLSSIDLWMVLICALVSGLIAVPTVAGYLHSWGLLVGAGRVIAVLGWLVVTALAWFLPARGSHDFPEHAWMFRGLNAAATREEALGSGSEHPLR